MVNEAARDEIIQKLDKIVGYMDRESDVRRNTR